MRANVNRLLPGLLAFILAAVGLLISPGRVSAADEAYVMGYFTENPGYSEAQYALHLAYSYDGLNYIPLNQNKPVAVPTLGNQGLRDPFILRKQDGNFVVIATDMKGINMGANTSKYIHVWDSTDGLQTFTNYRLLQVNNSTTMHAWAPEAFWDAGRGQYAIIWAGNTDRNRLYVSYTTDFKTVTNVNSLTVYHDPGYNIYDGDMLMFNGMYYFYNANGAIRGFKSDSLNPGSFTNNYVPSLNPAGAIEGPTLVQKINENVFWLWGDSYSPVNALFYVYQTNDISTNSWKLLNRREYEGPPNGKHNTICKVSLAELNSLIAKWGNPSWQRIKSYNYPDSFIRHTNNVGRIDVSVVDPMDNSKWKIVPGLADPDGISFESVSQPNYYLRQSNYSMVLNVNDNSSAFKADATFYKVNGLADSSWTSFRAYSDSTRYLRHQSNVLRIDPISTDTDKQDATFKIFYDTASTQVPDSGPKSAFAKTEAESYSSQSGVQAETCTEGGQDIGYIENGDYAVYKDVDFGGGASGFQARIATSTQGGNIEVRLDSIDGPLVGTCPVGTTGGFQSWADVSCKISGASGKHDVYLKFTGGSGYLFNLNWFQFIQSAFSRIEAESYSSVSSSSIQMADTPDGGKSLAYVENGNYALYGKVDFGNGADLFKAKVATTGSTSIEIRLGSSTGTLIGTLPVASTGGWNVYQEQSCAIDKVTGIKDVYLVFKGSVNFDCFSFSEDVKPNPVTLGDLNSDGDINSVDFLLMKKHILELETLADPTCADLDGNGAVNTVDLLLLKQYLLGIITDFPG